ncbi:MAG: hypothetical protein QNJ69_13485 [Gammaproteobacteria bacterium]|nr:hypothetical protein [Gammaproteobacteria bacterium]
MGFVWLRECAIIDSIGGHEKPLIYIYESSVIASDSAAISPVKIAASLSSPQ